MEQLKSRKITVRAIIILGIFLFFIGLIFFRFVYIQAAKEVQGQDLNALIEERWSQTHVIDGKRGTIFDREGEAIAEEVPSYTLIAILDDTYDNHIKDPKEAAQKLTTVLDLPVDAVEERFSQDLVQVEVSGARYLSTEVRQEIEDLEIDGITFREDPKRYYPNQTFASHLIGYTERDMSVARMGLEQSLDEYLSDESGEITYQKDGRGRRLADAENTISPPDNGNDVYLTIDTKIQMVLEQAMTQVNDEYSPERMIAIVADPKTGEILGMSNRPSFNPNHYEDISNYTNYAVSSRFEPGSTIKAFTLAAAIEEGVYDGEGKFRSGTYQIGPDTIPDHNAGEGWGEITFNEGVQRSSNVAFSKLALENLKPERFFDYVEAFGFRETTGIDLPQEANSAIADYRPIDAATTAFGQGSAITPIQQIQAATAIANGGKMMKPYVIDRIYDKDSEDIVHQSEPEVAGEPISESTSKQVLEILESVVTSSAGTGQPYAIEGFDIAGKTGTAQINDPDGPGRLSGHGNHIYSFLGMAPADDPEVIVYVAVDRPDIDLHESGSIPVSKVFKPVMQQSLQYMNITPQTIEEEHVEEAGLEVEDYTELSVTDVSDQLESAALNPIVIGENDEVISQFPSQGASVLPNEKVFLLTEGDSFAIPDFTGWSARHVYAWMKLSDLDVTIEGSGYVSTQSISPGTEVDPGTQVKIELDTERTEETTEEHSEPEDEDDDYQENPEETEDDEDSFFMD